MTDKLIVLDTETKVIVVQNETETKIIEVSKGQPGVGVATGGTVGQVLLKVDGTDYNTEWGDNPAAAGDHLLLSNIGTNTHVEIDTHLADDTIHFTEADFDMVVPNASSKINTPVHMATIDDYIDHIWSPTVTDGAVITDNLDGTVDIAETELTIRGGDEHTQLYTARIAATAGVTLTDNATNVVYADWNAGNPIIAVTLDPTTVDIKTKVPMYVIVREGNDVIILGSLEEGIDANAKLRKRFFFTEQYKRVDGGSIVSETGTRNLGCTAGSFYFGLRELTHDAIDTSITGSFEYYRLISGSWVETDETQFDNLQFNDISTPGSEVLATMANSKYAVHWVYTIPNDFTTEFAVIYSQDEYLTLAAAEAAGVPVQAPPSIAGLGQLLGRFIVKKDDTSGIMESVWTETFTSAVPTTHNGLADLQGGTTDQYYHLTSAEHTDTLAHIVDITNPHSVTQTQVGLGNVDNTTDLNKPISTATQTALDLKSDDGHNHVTADITDAATELATFAQGALADSATQPGDNVSTLTDDGTYVKTTGDTMTGSFILNRAIPQIQFVETLQAADESKWLAMTDLTAFELRAYDSTVSSFNTAIKANRTGYVVDSVELTVPTTTNVASAVDHLTRKDYVDDTTVSITGDTMTGSLTFDDASTVYSNGVDAKGLWNIYKSAAETLLITMDGTAGSELILTSDGTDHTNSVLTVGGWVAAGKAPTATSHLTRKDYVDGEVATKIGNIVEDTTPELGGDLDVNGFNIISADSAVDAAPAINILAGDCTSGLSSDGGGAINILAGSTNGTGSLADGGTVAVRGGDCLGTDGDGGGVYLIGGDGDVLSDGGGHILAWGGDGDGGAGGQVWFRGGTGKGAGSISGSGGPVRFDGGNATVGGGGGDVIFNGGSCVSTSAAGDILFTGGSALDGDAGTILFTPGQATGTGTNGSIQLHTTDNVIGQAELQFWNDTATGHTTGNQITLKAPACTSDQTITLPELTGTMMLNVVEDTTPQLGGTLDCLNKDIDNSKTVTFNGEIANTGTGLQNVDWNSGQKQNFTLTAATTISFTAPPGVGNFVLKLINPSTNITWGTTVLWPGGVEPTWTTTGTDILSLYYDGTNFYGMAGVNFS